MNVIKDFWRNRPTLVEASWVLVLGGVATLFVAPLISKAISKAKAAV